jgi:hypothetical protein
MAKRGKLIKKKEKEEEKKERPVRFRKYEYLFLIVCEDDKTEPAYFRTYAEKIPEDTLYLKTVGTGRDPKGVVETAVREKVILEKKSKKEVDFVWVVFDKDDADATAHTRQKFADAFILADTEKFAVAYSNEVFEFETTVQYVPS